MKHASRFMWDDDHVVITSLNWSSADTRADAPQAEIGLYITSAGLAADVRRAGEPIGSVESYGL